MLAVLTFVNRTAEETVEMKVDAAAVRLITSWYAAFYAGDDYDIYVNKRRQSLDHNGEIDVAVVDGKVVRSLLK